MFDVIIIGKGPAGISAALYIERSGLNAAIIGKDGGALAKSDKIQNYYGFAQPVSGKKLVEEGLAQAENLGAKLFSEEVVGIRWEDHFIVETVDGTYESTALLLATGLVRNTPKIAGMMELEGKGISYCAVCDAFFYRGKSVAVLGNGEYAIHEVKELLPLVKQVTLLTDGKEAPANVPDGVAVKTGKIKRVKGEETVEGVLFEDGEEIELAGVFVATGAASSMDFARKLGVTLAGNSIVVNEKMETNIPGLYAAGDCTGGLLQIAKAVYEGAQAGTQAIQFVRSHTPATV